MKCLINIPFGDVPRELIDQLNNCPFTYEDYMDSAILYDALPTYWNIAFLDEEDTIVGFAWGFFDVLDRFMHIIRFSFLPEFRRDKDHCVLTACSPLRELANYYGATNMFFISNKSDVFMSKVTNELYFSDGRVMEVQLHENLH